MSKDRKLKEKKQFLDQLFVPPKPKANEVLAESENYFPRPDFESSRNIDSSDLPADLLSLEKSVENITKQKSELDACNTESTVQNKSLTSENEKLRSQCAKATQKLAEKSQLLPHFGTRTFNKKERQKEEKISNLESSLEECKEKLEAAEKNQNLFSKNITKKKVILFTTNV